MDYFMCWAILGVRPLMMNMCMLNARYSDFFPKSCDSISMLPLPASAEYISWHVFLLSMCYCYIFFQSHLLHSWPETVRRLLMFPVPHFIIAMLTHSQVTKIAFCGLLKWYYTLHSGWLTRASVCIIQVWCRQGTALQYLQIYSQVYMAVEWTTAVLLIL